MEQKLRTPAGRARYLRRQASVEPVFGIIKKVIGFEQFSLRASYPPASFCKSDRLLG
jgi:hypothetical protein